LVYSDGLMQAYRPDSWQTKIASQQVEYPDGEHLARVMAEMAALPPLVTPFEINELKRELGRAAAGEAFLLQGGDCAESFSDCNADAITAKIKILLQMSVILVHGTRTPVIRVGRMAGQYAKPRSSETESRGSESLPAYRGEIVNRHGFTSEERTPNPDLMLRGYERAALTLNYVRALASGGFADLHHPENWNLQFAERSKRKQEYERIVESIRESIAFMEAIAGVDLPKLRRIDFYTSHEALMLRYETAQTKQIAGKYYNLSTHLPWIGMRTAQIDGAHVEYCRGIQNPLGIKLASSMTDSWLAELLEVLNPDDEPGRIVLIHRLGAARVRQDLPRLIECVQKLGKQVLWCADPMHGNTETTQEGIKTRNFDQILSELEQAFEVHKELGSRLGGVHFELTGEDVTECVGGASGVSEADLGRAYKSKVDPRLNYDQALEMALRITQHIKTQR
jgi:3-deoxy-7-phosphoheptulonate synthase